MNLIDLTGQTFGSWTVLRRADRREQARHPHWLCRCACGNEHEVLGNHLRHGGTSKCRDCAAAAQRGPGTCQWCGHPTREGAGPSFTTCMSCAQSATRRGRFACSKPRRTRRPRKPPKAEHACEECEPWPT